MIHRCFKSIKFIVHPLILLCFNNFRNIISSLQCPFWPRHWYRPHFVHLYQFPSPLCFYSGLWIQLYHFPLFWQPRMSKVKTYTFQSSIFCKGFVKIFLWTTDLLVHLWDIFCSQALSPKPPFLHIFNEIILLKYWVFHWPTYFLTAPFNVAIIFIIFPGWIRILSSWP